MSGAPGSNKDHKEHDQQPGHSFLSTLPEIKNMENSLLSLLNSFHAGELFVKFCIRTNFN